MGCFTILIIFVGLHFMRADGLTDQFSEYYSNHWGEDHLTLSPQGTEVQLKMDQSSGAGFKSKLEYGSGLFHIRMKIPQNKSGGVVTTFYLTSATDDATSTGNHFEIDYEFLGTNGTLQTNIYDNDTGHREETFKLWFDPSQDFHSYDVLWNSDQIVFSIDNIPIRVFKNNTRRGVPFPDRKMHIEASIWKGEADWVGDVDWNGAPFVAYYSDFQFDACPAQSPNDCNSPSYSWNSPQNREVDEQHKAQMASYRKKYMVYDYCSKLFPKRRECSFQL